MYNQIINQITLEENMKKMTFEVDDALIETAESILDSLGLDMDIAFNIFVKKIIKEKGLPFSLSRTANPTVLTSAPYQDSNLALTDEIRRRSNRVISQEMIVEVWNTFKRFRVDIDDIYQKRDEISNKTGMNQGSALIYLYILVKLSKGEENKRAMKPSDFEYFVQKFKQEQNPALFRNVLQSIRVSIPYWRRNIPTFANTMELLLKKYED
jgi:DNA-damage-inducible protein J